MKIKVLLAVAFFALALAPALAAPTIDSVDDQSFDQHQNIEQVRDITITDDATTPVITAAGDIRIQIPADFPAIWDDRVASVNIFGSAVDAGRFAGSVANVIYEDDDKVAVVAVAADFAAGESVTISGLFFEGFYWAGANYRLQLILEKNGEAVASDSKSLQVWTSLNEDSHEPDAPENISLKQIGSSVEISWTDPPDMDASQIQILRGVDPLPIAGTAFAEEGRGVEFFVDDELAIGDTVSYILRASDGRNVSQNSETVSITLVENPTPEPVVCTTDYTPVCGSDGTTYSNACNAEAAGITEHSAGECEVAIPVVEEDEAKQQKATAAGITIAQLDAATNKYSDLATDHWSAGFLARLNSDKIIDGYPDGTIQPDTTINRAELAKIVANSFGLNESIATNFTDIPTNSWFASFVGALAKVGATWTSDSEFHPADGVARGEAVWTILTAAGIDIPAISEKPFPDVSTSHPYAAAIAWAKNNSIISGYDDGTFGIRDTLTRAQVAKIIVLLEEKLAD